MQDSASERSVDRLQRIGHLVIEAFSKARELSRTELDSEFRARAATIMKRAGDLRKKIEGLNRAPSNGKGLDHAAMASAMDELIETIQEVNKRLDDLLAKAKGRE